MELVQVPKGEIILVKAEEVTQLMEISSADFFGKNLGVAVGEFPEIVQVENDPGGRFRSLRVGLQSAGSFKETE